MLSEEFENEANYKEEKYNKSFTSLRQRAAYLRSDADIIEEEYNKKVKKLIK